MVGDFNLHYLYWGGQPYFARYVMANGFIEFAVDAHLNLLLPAGEIIRDIKY